MEIAGVGSNVSMSLIYQADLEVADVDKNV